MSSSEEGEDECEEGECVSEWEEGEESVRGNRCQDMGGGN